MKLLPISLAIFLFFGISQTLFAQYDYLPSFIERAFRQKYPAVLSSDWEYENPNFIYTFLLNDEDCTAEFATNGEWLQTICNKKLENLPKAVKNKTEEYTNCITFDFQLIESASTTESIYRFNAECESEDFKIDVSQRGEELSKKPIKPNADTK